MSFESAFKQVKQLVEDFKSHEKNYLAPDYQEAQVRKDFIDKFFIALGWDVNHETQKNPYEQEVKVEKTVKVGAAQKKADYSFSLAPRFIEPKFYVEAKKPSRSLKNPDDYFQAVRYGWNSQHPIAVLTDFEEFHIIDSRFKPDIKTAIVQGTKEYHYLDYADEQKFRQIYHIFSRDDVANGSIDKFAEDHLPKVKKARKVSKAGIQQVDESFLEELDSIRDDLAKAIKKSNPSFDGETLTEAVQRIIDRIVFIRFLEDKLIEQDHIISALGDRKTPWIDFVAESRKLDAKYNGLVFKKHLIDDEKDFIPPAEKVFAGVCKQMSHINSPFNFAQIPIHILGSIYERFLGKVINATEKRATVEEKPEVRKAGGVYYTPQYIVDYIVENTVGKLIEGKTPKEISKMAFADISCGSGSFLITVFDVLIRYHGKWYNEHPDEAKKAGCKFSDDKGAYVLTVRQKQQILLNNVYGVDIDYQAVEVTQLSLFLKLLEDETTASADETISMFKEKLLPDLSKNIVCGNSLIGTDIYEGSMFPTDEERKINAMNFEDRFPEIMQRGGFDAIVGNPPYDVLEKDRGESSWPHIYLSEYVTLNPYLQYALGGKQNLYRFFIVQAINLLRKSGYFGMILPLSILGDYSTSLTRKFLLDNLCTLNVDAFPQKDLPSLRVFFNAKVSTTILTFQKEECSHKHIKLKVYPFNKFEDERKCKIDVEDLQKITSDTQTIPLVSNEQWSLLTKIHLTNNIQSLSSINDIIINRGEINQTIYRDYITENLKDAVLIKGVQIGQYILKSEISQGKIEWFDEKAFLLNHNFKEIVKFRRIATQRITGVDEKLRIVATIVNPPAYFADSTNSIYLTESSNYTLEYILALLNSKLFQWRFKLTSTNNNVGTNELHNLPFREINFENEVEKSVVNDISTLVHQIIDAKKKMSNSKTEKDVKFYTNRCNSMDNSINSKIYTLYNLTPEEIKIVEEANA